MRDTMATEHLKKDQLDHSATFYNSQNTLSTNPERHPTRSKHEMLQKHFLYYKFVN